MGRVPISQMDLPEIFKDRKVAENMAGAHVEEFEMGKWVVTAKQQTALKAHSWSACILTVASVTLKGKTNGPPSETDV